MPKVAPARNDFVVHVEPSVAGGKYLRFRLELQTAEGYIIEVRGCQVGTKADGTLFAKPPFLRFRPIRWNKKLEDDILGLLQKKGVLKRLKGDTGIKFGEEETLTW